jgi:hypothetical protein
VSAAVQAPVVRTEIIHNSRILMAVYVCLAVATWASSVCMVVEGVSLLFPLRTFGFMRGLGVLQWTLGGLCLFFTAGWMWRQGTKKWHYRVELDANGVKFVCKLVDGRGEWYTPWDQITRVTCATKNGVQLFRVQTADPDSYFTYDSFTFTRPKTIAMRVAAACGKPLENVKWDE